ncbi:hypothetical protein ACFL9S_07940 [Erwinia sp. AnSW2-5]|uniref:hypothetical protein n=1 Tax=Erwinia sp. AnSW2-5 TaxID=3367692 RepID=UPI00385DC0CB
MDFSLKTFMHAGIGGSGLGFGSSGFVPLLFPSMPFTDFMMYFGAIAGAVVFILLYLYFVWQDR